MHKPGRPSPPNRPPNLTHQMAPRLPRAAPGQPQPPAREPVELNKSRKGAAPVHDFIV